MQRRWDSLILKYLSIVAKMGKKDENRKKKKKGKGKKEREEVNKHDENLSSWTRADYVAGRKVEIMEQFEKLLNKFERPPSQIDRPEFFEEYEFSQVRVDTANRDSITRVVHLVIKSLHDLLEHRQTRGFQYGSDEPVVLTHRSKVPDVLWHRLFKMLRLNEKVKLTPISLGWGGSMVSYQKSKKLYLNWTSEWGELTEIEALFETLGAIAEGEDTTNNETGCVVRLGELVIHKILQIRNALLRLFIEPAGAVEDARSSKSKNAQERKILAERQGEIVFKQFREDVELGFGLSLENLTAELDLRPNDVKLSHARKEVVRVVPTKNLCQQPLEKSVVQDAKKLVASIEKDLLGTLRDKSSKTEAKELKRIEDEVKDVESIIVVLKRITGIKEQQLMRQALALYIRQCLVKLEELVNSGLKGSSAVDYARVALMDLKSQYQKTLVENIEVASEEVKASFNQMLVDIGLAVPYPRDRVEVEDEEPPELEDCPETDTEYEEEENCTRLGSFSILMKTIVKQYSGKGEERKLDGKITQERIDVTLLDELVETLKNSIVHYVNLLIIHENEIREAQIRLEHGSAAADDEEFVKKQQEKAQDARVQIEQGMKQLRDLLHEVKVSLELQVKRVVKSLQELDDPNLTLERCKMAMMAATTTKMEDYIAHATLESKISNQTNDNIQVIIDCLVEIDEMSVAKETSAIVEEVKNSWTELSIHKIETFKTAIRRKSEIKGKTKKPSKGEEQAARWLGEIQYYIDSQVDPGNTEHAREMYHQTRELTVRNEVEELIKHNYYKSEEETRKVLKKLKKHGVQNCIKVIQILRQAMVRWNDGFEVIATFSQFMDYPELYIKYLPVNGRQRVEYQAKQLGKCSYADEARANAKDSLRSGRRPRDRGPDECEKELERFATACRGFSSNKEVSENNQKSVMIMTDTQELVTLNDEEFMRRLPRSSYGWFVVDKNRHCHESFGEARSQFQKGITHVNSDLRVYYRDPLDEPVETLDSCGKNCQRKTECKVKARYPGQIGVQCGQEYVVLVKDDVSAEELQHSMKSFVSYNGQRASIEERTISVEGKGFTSKMLLLIKPYTEVTRENHELAIKFLEQNCMFSFEPVLDGYYPKLFGLDDTEAKNRTRFFFRTSLLVVPGWMGMLAWLVSNTMTEVGSGDSRTTTPRWNQFVLCSHCARRFMSPISLLFHRVYSENAINYTSEEGEIDHSKCHQYSVCWCRLVKPWRSPKEKTSGDSVGLTRKVLDGPVDSSIIKEEESRVFGAYRKIQLGSLAYQDAGTCPIGEIINGATLLCQIQIYCRMPGKNFSKKANLSLGVNWIRGSYWSNMFTAKGLKEELYGASRTMEPDWSLHEGSAVKLDFRGKVVEIDLCQAFSEYVDDTENTRENALKMGSICSELNNVDYNREDSEEYVAVDFIAKRTAQLEWLENFVNVDEEVILYNYLNFLSVPVNENPDSELSERQLLLSKFIVANFAISCTSDEKLIRGLYKMRMKDAAPYLSRESPMSAVCNESIRNKDILKPKMLDFNRDPKDGQEIVPGRDLKVKVPGFKKDAEIAKLVDGWDNELYRILTKGWPKELDNVDAGLSSKFKKVPETKGKGPKMKTSFVEPIVARRESVEKPDLQDENIELRIQKWRCTTCTPLTRKIPRHKAPGACFEDNSKPVRNRIRNELKTMCVEAKMKRLAEEEAAKQKAEGASENSGEEEVEKLMESFNKSMEKEDLNEQCDVAVDLYSKVKRVAENKMAKTSEIKSEQPVTNLPVLQPRESVSGPYRVVVTNDNVREKPENLEVLEESETLTENAHVSDVENLPDLVEGISGLLHPNSWCTGGIVAGEWVQCENGPLCENCKY